MPAAEDLSPPTPNLRRKLIRGAFAAPSLLTVYSGSAFAASSHLRGLVNANANPVDVTAIVDGIDPTYARVQLYMVQSMMGSTSGSSGDDPSPISSDDDKKATKPTKKPKVDSTGKVVAEESAAESTTDPLAEPEPLSTVTRFYVLGSALATYKTSGSSIPGTGQWLEFNPSTFEPVGAVETAGSGALPSNKYITVRFDEKGYIVGLGGSGDGAVVTNSVLASATPFII